MSDLTPSHEPDSGFRLLGGVLVIVLAGAALGLASNQIQRLSGSSRALPFVARERKLATLESVMPPAPAPATTPATGTSGAAPASVAGTTAPAAPSPREGTRATASPGASDARAGAARSAAGAAPGTAGSPGAIAGTQLGSRLAPGPGASPTQAPPHLVPGTLPGTSPSPGLRPGVRETTLAGRGPDAAGPPATRATIGTPSNPAPATGTRAAPGAPPTSAPALPAIPDTREPLEVGYATVKALHDADAALFVDARSAGEFAEGHIPGAVNLPFDDVFSKPELAKSLDPHGRPIVTYCGGGDCELSKNLAFSLIEAGQKKVLVFTTGLPGWKDAGNPVVTGQSP